MAAPAMAVLTPWPDSPWPSNYAEQVIWCERYLAKLADLPQIEAIVEQAAAIRYRLRTLYPANAS